MNIKHIITIIAGSIVCILCGFTLGFLSGSGKLHGELLSGTGFEGLSQQSADSQQMDLETLIMSLQMQRTDSIDGQLQSMMQEMKAANEAIEEAQAMLALCRSLRDSGGTPSYELTDFCSANGISMPSGSDYSSAEWDMLTDAIKAHLDAMNSTNQLDMIRLQSLMDKRNQAYEMMSNMIQKDQLSKDAIIGNMR